MTQYVGEEYRITASALGYAGETLGELDVSAMTITILNRDRTVLVDEAAMTWADVDSKWEYLWDTDGLTAGTYRYRVTVTGDDGRINFEWLRTRLARTPTIVT